MHKERDFLYIRGNSAGIQLKFNGFPDKRSFPYQLSQIGQSLFKSFNDVFIASNSKVKTQMKKQTSFMRFILKIPQKRRESIDSVEQDSFINDLDGYIMVDALPNKIPKSLTIRIDNEDVRVIMSKAGHALDSFSPDRFKSKGYSIWVLALHGNCLEEGIVVKEGRRPEDHLTTKSNAIRSQSLKETGGEIFQNDADDMSPVFSGQTQMEIEEEKNTENMHSRSHPGPAPRTDFTYDDKLKPAIFELNSDFLALQSTNVSSEAMETIERQNKEIEQLKEEVSTLRAENEMLKTSLGESQTEMQNEMKKMRELLEKLSLENERKKEREEKLQEREKYRARKKEVIDGEQRKKDKDNDKEKSLERERQRPNRAKQREEEICKLKPLLDEKQLLTSHHVNKWISYLRDAYRPQDNNVRLCQSSFFSQIEKGKGSYDLSYLSCKFLVIPIHRTMAASNTWTLLIIQNPSSITAQAKRDIKGELIRALYMDFSTDSDATLTGVNSNIRHSDRIFCYLARLKRAQENNESHSLAKIISETITFDPTPVNIDQECLKVQKVKKNDTGIVMLQIIENFLSDPIRFVKESKQNSGIGRNEVDVLEKRKSIYSFLVDSIA